MKHVKLFEQFIDLRINEGYYSSSDIKKLKEFAEETSEEIKWVYAGDKKFKSREFSAKKMLDYILEWGEMKDLTADEVISTFDYTSKDLQRDLGLAGLDESKVNEAMKVNPTGDRFGSYDLEAAGVEVPNFRIDLTSLRNRRLEIIEKFRNITSLRKALIVDPTLSIDKKKIEKDLENAVKAFNADSKKAYQEFEKVLKAVKFPDDAKFTVEFEVDPKGEFFPSYSEAFMDFDQKDPVKLFMAWIKPTYYYLAPRKRNEQRWRTASSWAGMIEGRIDPGFLKTAVVPPILDRDFILMNFLNSSNTLDR